MNKWLIILVVVLLASFFNFKKSKKKPKIKNSQEISKFLNNNLKKPIKPISKKIKKTKQKTPKLNKPLNDKDTRYIKEQVSFIISNFNSLEAIGTPKGKLVFKKMQSILKAPPKPSFEYLRNLINSNKLKTEREKQFFIQLANRIQVNDKDKFDLLYEIANKYFYRENFETDQELYTAEIAFESAKNAIQDQEQLEKLEELKNNVENERLRILLEKI